MIVLAIILAAAVLELGLVSFAFRQGRTVAERDAARRERDALELRPRGGVHVIPGMPMPVCDGDPSPRVPPAPVRPSPMRPEKW